MNLAMFVYECSYCDIKFGVDEDFEDHAVVTCPVCGVGSNIHDVGSLAGIVQENESE